MNQCIDPTEIGEGDWMAYVDGDADPHVRAHIANCPACAEKVRHLRESQRDLMRLLYRVECPLPEVLIQYRQGKLSANERLAVAAHLRQCQLCPQELAELTDVPDELWVKIMQTLKQVKGLIEATLLIPPASHRLTGLGSVDLRGGQPTSISPQPSQSAYRAGGLDILVSYHPPEGKNASSLLGTVVQAEKMTGDRVWLFPKGEDPLFSLVDELGVFEFENVPAGDYSLVLEMGQDAIVIRRLQL